MKTSRCTIPGIIQRWRHGEEGRLIKAMQPNVEALLEKTDKRVKMKLSKKQVYLGNRASQAWYGTRTVLEIEAFKAPKTLGEKIKRLFGRTEGKKDSLYISDVRSGADALGVTRRLLETVG